MWVNWYLSSFEVVLTHYNYYYYIFQKEKISYIVSSLYYEWKAESFSLTISLMKTTVLAKNTESVP